MPWTFQQKLRVGFWLLAFIPVILGVVAYRNAYSAAAAADDVARTNDIVKSLESFLSDLKDIEVAQREFVLTGDERHAMVIDRSRARFETGLQRLRQMRAERHWMELLESLLPQKFEEVRKTIELRRTQGMEAASKLLEANPGLQAMDDIRRTVNRMIADENRALVERSAAQKRSFLNTMIVFGIVLVLDVSLIWTIAYLVRREQSKIRALNEDLERRVTQRTEALQRSNEDLQNFAYTASHDLKEPLRMISSYSTLLQRKYQRNLDADADTYIGFITDGAKRMNTLINDLLEYSRAGEVLDESLVPVDTNAVIKGVLANLEVTVADARAKVTVGKLPKVVYDPVRLGQVFQNLIANAIKYHGEQRPEIEIKASQNGRETIFSVKDNGIGMDPGDVHRIFGVFKRLHGKEYEGTGIGLATVKKIVERQGGRIWAESAPGVGSTFYFTVPHSQGLAEGTSA